MLPVQAVKNIFIFIAVSPYNDHCTPWQRSFFKEHAIQQSEA